METNKVRVIDHPLAKQCLVRLRDKTSNQLVFKTALERLATILAIEATSSLQTKKIKITTPLEVTEGEVIDDTLVIVPILRAGLALLSGFEQLFPNAIIGHIGLARDEKTLEPKAYLSKLPDLSKHLTLVIDPMLATGGSSAWAVSQCKNAGAKRVLFICSLAAPEGIKHLHQEHPDVPIITACIDRQLNEKGFILPGLGDAGDRYFGTE